VLLFRQSLISILVSIWSGSNKLTLNIPTSIGNLSSLTRLDCRFNKLTGSIPASIGDWSSLTWLHLKGSQLTGTIPASILNMRGLDLFTDGNQLI